MLNFHAGHPRARGSKDLGSSIQGAVIPGEGVEGACTDPPAAQLLSGVSHVPTDVCACIAHKAFTACQLSGSGSMVSGLARCLLADVQKGQCCA